MTGVVDGYQVYLACESIDMRKSINGLSAMVQGYFMLDPFSSALFVFCNKGQDKIKLLQWDRNGFWLHYKRLEKGPVSVAGWCRCGNREYQPPGIELAAGRVVSSSTAST